MFESYIATMINSHHVLTRRKQFCHFSPTALADFDYWNVQGHQRSIATPFA